MAVLKAKPNSREKDNYSKEDRWSNQESVSRHTSSDLPSSPHALDFELYTNALCSFLIDPQTSPPLSVSIDGEWGTGKSSFLRQIKWQLLANKKLVVHIDAWQHEETESLWVTFASEVLKQLKQQLNWHQRLKGHWVFVKNRYNIFSASIDILRLLLGSSIFLGCTILFCILFFKYGIPFFNNELDVLIQSQITGEKTKHFLSILLKAAGVATPIVTIIGLRDKILSLIGNPFAINISKHLKVHGTRKNISRLKIFQQDYELIINAYARKETIYVLIDDLDRCAPLRTAEFIESLMLVRNDSSKMIYISAFDHEKVASSIAAKYASTLSFLYDVSVPLRRQGLNYGYAFLEKFTQLSFRIPIPSKKAICRYVDSISGIDNKTTNRVRNQNESRIEALLITFEKESQNIRDLLCSYAQFLDNNPRRVKHFINSFRLHAYIAYLTGLFTYSLDNVSKSEDDIANLSPLSLEILSKYVIMCQLWPELIVDVSKNHDLLAILQKVADGKVEDSVKKPDGAVDKWKTNEQLIKLLNFNIQFSATKSRISFEHIDIRNLIMIGPRLYSLPNQNDMSIINKI